MSPIDLQVRRLGVDDAALYRDIRLDGLRHNPEAFGSTFDRESAEPLSWFEDRVENHPVFGAFRGDALVGIAGLMFHQGKRAHIAMVWGMYVRPDARNHGIAGRLVETLLDHARARVEVVQLAVIVENIAARRVYERAGFVSYGVEKKALKQDGGYFDEVLMAVDLLSTGQY